jgi:hypothetical protein
MGAVIFRDKVEEVNILRVQYGLQTCLAEIPDRSRRETRVSVGVVRRIHL